MPTERRAGQRIPRPVEPDESEANEGEGDRHSGTQTEPADDVDRAPTNCQPTGPPQRADRPQQPPDSTGRGQKVTPRPDLAEPHHGQPGTGDDADDPPQSLSLIHI